LKFQKVGVLWNPGKTAGVAPAGRLLENLRARGVSIRLNASLAHLLEAPAHEQGRLDDADLMIILGGDGTLLSALDIAVPNDIPMLGINLGRVGFLTEVEPQTLEEDLARVFAGDFWLDQRMTMQIEGEDARKFFALNEVTIMRKDPSVGILSLEVFAGADLVDRISGDGLIVASTTGSTAYSLSAGGPIIAPGLDCFVLTPVCSHTMSARPVVVSADDRVTVRVLDCPDSAQAVLDGRRMLPLTNKRPEIAVVKSPLVAKFIRLRQRNYFSLLHQKLSQWTH